MVRWNLKFKMIENLPHVTQKNCSVGDNTWSETIMAKKHTIIQKEAE